MSGPTEQPVIEFECPDCKRPCRFSSKQRALQHSDPTCKTWRAHKGKGQEFMKLAFMARGGNALDLSNAFITPTEAAKQKADLVEQLHEGLKKL